MGKCKQLEPGRLATFLIYLPSMISHAKEDPRQALTAHSSTMLSGTLSPPTGDLWILWSPHAPEPFGPPAPAWEPFAHTPAHEPLSTAPPLCSLPPHPEAPPPRPILVPLGYPVRSHLKPHADALAPARSADRSPPSRPPPYSPAWHQVCIPPAARLRRPVPPGPPVRLPPDRSHPTRHHGSRPHGSACPPPGRPAPPTGTTWSGRPTPTPPPLTDPQHGYRISGSGYMIPARMAAAVAAPARSAGSGTARPSTCDPHIMNRAAGLRPVGPLHTCSSSCRRSAFLSSDRWPSDIRPLGISPYSRGYTRCTRSDSVGA